MQIVFDLHPGEASWQASVTENTIGIVKDTMTRIALERLDLESIVVLTAVVFCRKMRWSGFVVSLRIKGHWDVHRTGINYSSTLATKLCSRFLEHLQGMEAAGDAWLKARKEEGLKRASRARNRPLAYFRLGDDVDFWRRGKGKGARPHIKGRFHRGAAVLATNTDIDEEDGSRSRERSSASLTREF